MSDLLGQPEHYVTPLPAGEVLTSSMLRSRLETISSMCTAGQPLRPIISELRYLADALDQVDRSFRKTMTHLTDYN